MRVWVLTGTGAAYSGKPQGSPCHSLGKGDEGKGDEGKGDEGKGDEGKGDGEGEGDGEGKLSPFVGGPGPSSLSSRVLSSCVLSSCVLSSCVLSSPSHMLSPHVLVVSSFHVVV